ncbi:MAG TPA: sulfurtransferase TusA family protein [Actinomycetales bacterium]|nr:sulfurtransferase TusA family protein [Actinomycetales bacterium]
MTTSADELLDNRSTPCAVGLIRAAERMSTMPPGSTLEIWSRDHFAPMEIPLWAERDGYDVLSRDRGGRWPRRFFTFVVRRPD